LTAASATTAGSANTATALFGNGSNCTIGNYPLGVDNSGNVESCTAIPGSHSPVTTTTIGILPNAAGMTLIGQQLNLEPASGLFGGVVNTLAQTFAGIKTFSNTAAFTNGLGIGTGYNINFAANADKVTWTTGVGGSINATTYTGNASTSSYALTAASATTAGSANTATALAGDGSNCSAGSYPLGVDASGNVQSCTFAGGGVTGSGTVNTIPKWTPSTTSLGNSAITDDGTTINISRNTANTILTLASITTGSPIINLSAGTGGIGVINSTGSTYNILKLQTASTDRLTIDGTGNIGIGTTAPLAKLEVNGNILLSNTAVNKVISLGDINIMDAIAPSLTIKGSGNIAACFSGDTVITTPNGTEEISNLKIGDTVISYDIDKKIRLESKVIKIFSRTVPEYYQLEIGSKTIRTTAEHPFYTQNGWTLVKNLSLDDKLFDGESWAKITKITLIKDSLSVYNLHVDAPNNYFAAGVLVHNKSGTSEGGGIILDTGQGILAPGDVILVPNGGNVGIGTNSPGANLSFGPNFGSDIFLYETGGTGYGFATQNSLLEIFVNNATERVGIGYNWSAFVETLTVKGDKVGINTITPADKLDVNGAVYLDPITAPSPTTNRLYNVGGNLTWNGIQLGAGGTNFWGGTKNGNIWNGDAGVGNVGIGTTAPARKLEIVDSIAGGANDILRINNSSAGAFDQVRLTLTRAADTGTGVARGMSLFGTGGASGWADYENRALSFWTGSGAAATEKLRLSALGGLSLGSAYVANDPGAGNLIVQNSVGIGMTAPGTYDLNVAGTTLHSDDVTLNKSGGAVLYIAPSGSGSATLAMNSNTGGSSIINAAGTNNILKLQTASTDRVTITSTGNVGIGTTTPAVKLSMISNFAGDGFVVSAGVSTYSPQFSLNDMTKQLGAVGLALGANHFSGIALANDIVFRATGATTAGNLIITNQNATGDIKFATGSTTGNDTLKMVINNTGNVGIGSSTPAQKLVVNGNVAAVSYIYTSDRSLKKNIKTLENPLEKIMKLRGVSFNWKDNDVASIGLIAQEVEKVYPELVTGSAGGMGVQYGNLVGPLVEAVKAQQKEIDTLEARIKVLELKNKRK
ncbi:MAG: tail fiber domain-containing protein, partial [Candidatus Falkowbacteria bacterium]